MGLLFFACGKPSDGPDEDDPSGCVYEGDGAFCVKNEASCGDVTATDGCGEIRTVDCGGCSGEEVCGLEAPNRCSRPSVCEGEASADLCRKQNRRCGTWEVEDRCGDTRTITCGSCAQNQTCNSRGVCERKILGEREACFRRGVEQGLCGTGLVCSGTEDLAVCLPTCSSDRDCRAGQTCAIDYLADEGIGVCGTPRVQGQRCREPEAGPDFCWDNSSPADNGSLQCVNGTCDYICSVRGMGNIPCPPGRICGSTWKRWSGTDMEVKVCESAPPVGDGEVCFNNGNEIASCGQGSSCILFGDDLGLCMRTCESDEACGAGTVCALGFLEGGGGVCGNPRKEGESCSIFGEGSDWCWDNDAPDSLVCVEGTCSFICQLGRPGEGPSWPCPDPLECGPSRWSSEYLSQLSVCVDNRSDERGDCLSDRDCKPGLACLDDGQVSRCQPVCEGTEGCTDGRICLQDTFPDGRGVCVRPRSEGESCHVSVQQGNDACFDAGVEGSTAFACVSGRCRHVCDWENDALPPSACPEGLFCSSSFVSIPGATARGAICEPPCQPETDSQLCASRGAGCGSIQVRDRCGNDRTVACGSCPSGSACNGTRCLSSNIPENGACLDRSRNVVACATGLTCVVWGTGVDSYGACKKTCDGDRDCGGRICANGVLAGGGGICGTPREAGQTCSSIKTGSNFCWDIMSPVGSALDCLNGRCGYVCGIEGTSGQYSCPWGTSCGSTYRNYDGWPNRLQVCE